MQEFISHLMEKVGISEEQATKAVNATKDFIQSKVPPQFSGIIDNFLGHKSDDATANTEASATGADQGGIMDKASDMAEAAKEKAGEWADKAEDMAGDALNKLKGLFGGGK